MPISDLCKTNLVCIDGSSTLQFAAQMMKQNHVGGLVVVEANGRRRPIGVLTDRDIVLSVVANNQPLFEQVSNVMSKDVVTVDKDEGIAEVVDKMERAGVRRMVVIDKDGQACGLVSSDDILQLVAREMNGLGRLVANQVNKEREHMTAPLLLV